MEIKTDAYKKEGMYLHFANGDFFDLSVENIKRLGDEFWGSPEKLPVHIRCNDAFKTCTVCPYKGQDVFCSAMKPLLPFLEGIEKFASYDDVAAIYLNKYGVLSICETKVQAALQYVTNMSVFQYCESMKQYSRYFKGIAPFMTLEEVASRIFLNIYWLNKRNSDKLKQVIQQLCNDVTVTSESCIKRLRLMCHSDAFMNAYIETHIYPALLSINSEEVINKYFDEQS